MARSTRAARSLVGATALVLIALAVLAQDAVDFASPKRHFRVERPADLTPSNALVVYDRILDQMTAAYALSRDPAVRYRRWRRYNRTPFRSAAHGDRFVNVYANPIGQDYGLFEQAGEMPPGTIIAKDSFTVTANGDVFTGPLALMEKLEPGTHPETRDWRYSMIMPDGSYFGVSDGDNAEQVAFCAPCHAAAGDDNDHLFFIPEDNRIEAFRLDDLLQ